MKFKKAGLDGIFAFSILAVPLAAHAQQPARVPRIGYLSLHAPSELDGAFRKGLREKGWIESQNIAIEYR